MKYVQTWISSHGYLKIFTLNTHSSFLQIPIRGPEAVKACPGWHAGIPNLKSSAVLSVDGVLYDKIHLYNIQCSEICTLRNEKLHTEA